MNDMPGDATPAISSSMRIPTKVIGALAVSGLLSIELTGVLGYRADATIDFSDPFSFLDSLSYKPWLLFAWLCAFIFALQYAIFWQQPLPAKRWQQWRASIVVTGVCIVLVGVFDLYGQQIRAGIEGLLSQTFQKHGLFYNFISDPWVYMVLNFGIILYLAVTALRRWFRLHNELQRAAAKVDRPPLAGGLQADQAEQKLPELDIVVIGDVVLRSLMILALSLVVSYNVLRLVIPTPPKVNPPLTTFTSCSVALPGMCQTSISFVDFILGSLFLIIGVAAAGILTQQRVPPEAERPRFAHIGGLVADTLLDILLRPFGRAGGSRAALDSNAYDSWAILRSLGWPLLILLGTAGAAEVARDIQAGLHHHHIDQFNLNNLSTILVDSLTHTFTYSWPAIIGGVLALAGVTLSAAILLQDGSVINRALGLLKTVGTVTLFLYFVYTLALWLFQNLLVGLGAQDPVHPERLHAFDLGSLTVLSLLLLLGFGIPEIFKRIRTPRQI